MMRADDGVTDESYDMLKMMKMRAMTFLKMTALTMWKIRAMTMLTVRAMIMMRMRTLTVEDEKHEIIKTCEMKLLQTKSELNLSLMTKSRVVWKIKSMSKVKKKKNVEYKNNVVHIFKYEQ